MHRPTASGGQEWLWQELSQTRMYRTKFPTSYSGLQCTVSRQGSELHCTVQWCVLQQWTASVGSKVTVQSVAGWEGETGLIWVKESGRTGFSSGLQGCSEGFPKGKARGKSRVFFRGFPRAGRAAPRDFRRAKLEGNPEEQPCQPENPALPESFTQINPIWTKLVRNAA